MANVSTPVRRVLVRACFISLSAGPPRSGSPRVSKVDGGVGWANPHYFAKLCSGRAPKGARPSGISRADPRWKHGLFGQMAGVATLIVNDGRPAGALRGIGPPQGRRCTAATLGKNVKKGAHGS